MVTGDQIGPWEVLEPIGEGGMGQVWACRHVDEDRRGALKVLHSGMGADPLARFKREMLALDKLRHHAIVSLLDHDLEHPQMPWLVMEQIEGSSLEATIDDGPLSAIECLGPFAALADGLAQAHAYGVHHRDVKANNVIRRPNGSMVLVDFGAAIDDDSSQVTRAGLLLGTTRYLPPEVVFGEDRDNVSADIYALGMLLHECLTGAHAFQTEKGKAIEGFRGILRLKMSMPHLDPGPDFSDEVRHLVQVCTAADPDARLDRMEDLADLLEVASGVGTYTPMQSLRQSERISQLGGGEAANMGSHPPSDMTVLRSRPPLLPAHALPSPEDEPTLSHKRESDTPQNPRQRGPARLGPPQTKSTFDWPIFGAFVVWALGMFASAFILVAGVVLALIVG